ncbi:MULTISPECIES: cytochrome c oxidase subunit II [Streptomyces]|uniref:cytochrome c oxidase subunit II n=1 Tax=Streptomyces lycopersici TaxID=2974589 RepID=UPI0021D35883|nr:cytochrome c oxidase subunit II [Streptomyces sp. NEAU-383]
MDRRRIFDEVFTLEVAAASFVFLAVMSALVFSVARRRAGAGVTPSGRAERLGLEWCYVAALAAVAVFLVLYTALANHREQHTVTRPTVRVDVTGFQWCWRFRNTQRQAGPVAVTATCHGGRMPTLVVPTGQKVQFRITSRDVIHSLWVPALRYKMDAFPDHVNTFTLTIDREGRWIGRCAEFCGQRHQSMDFWLKAVSPKKYATWLHHHAIAGSGAAV